MDPPRAPDGGPPRADLSALAAAAPPRITRSGFTLLRILGIRVHVHPSWLLLLALLLVSLSLGWFPALFPDASPATHWTAGTITTVLLIVSLLLHELAHSLVAQREGIAVPEITLFVFGGASRLAGEPPGPAAEARIAIVGPLASLVLAGVFGALSWLPTAPVTQAVLAHLGWVNLALAVFNLVPGFPMDGGRVLRAILWWRTGSLVKATRWAAAVGSGVALLLMLFGALQILAGNLLGGVWILVLGGFLRVLAGQGYRNTLIRRTLEEVAVRELTVEEAETVRPDETLAATVERFLRSGRPGLPVVSGGRVLGLLEVSDVAAVAEDRRAGTRVDERMHPLDEGLAIGPDEPLSEALTRMQRDGTARLVVLDRDGALLGTVAREGVVELLRLRGVLNGS